MLASDRAYFLFLCVLARTLLVTEGANINDVDDRKHSAM